LNLILNPILDSRQAAQNHFGPLISPHALISTSHLPNLGPIERLSSVGFATAGCPFSLAILEAARSFQIARHPSAHLIFLY
jgi:hypothetical protein